MKFVPLLLLESPFPLPFENPGEAAVILQSCRLSNSKGIHQLSLETFSNVDPTLSVSSDDKPEIANANRMTRLEEDKHFTTCLYFYFVSQYFLARFFTTKVLRNLLFQTISATQFFEKLSRNFVTEIFVSGLSFSLWYILCFLIYHKVMLHAGVVVTIVTHVEYAT